MLGLGPHNRKMKMSNQKGQINVQDGSMVIAWDEREGVEGDGRCWKVGRHPHPINGRFACPVALLEGDWWEESRVSREDGFLKTKVSTEGRNLCFPDTTIHFSHKDGLIAIQLSGGDSSTKIVKECSPGWAGVTLTE